MNPQAICDSKGRPIPVFLSAGQVGDEIRARASWSRLPETD